jgi:hypothetical protein
MAEKIVVLTQFSSPIEAQLAKNQLEAAGIKAFLSGQEATGLFGGLGGALGGVQLHVAEADLEKACEVLEEADEDLPEPDAESSTDIRAERPAQATEETYRAREEAVSEGPAVPVNPPPAPVDEALEEAADEEHAEPGGEDMDEDVLSVMVTPDQVAGRALRASLFGLLLCPPLLHFYSLFLIFQMVFFSGELTGSGTCKVWVALAIDFAVLLMIALMVGSAMW